MAVTTFHIKKGQIRTTVSLERVLMDLLSIQLVGKVELSAVTKWAQEQVDEDPGAFATSTSQRLASKAALTVARKELRERYWDLVLAEKPKRHRKSKRRL
jgi:hypothetical protein